MLNYTHKFDVFISYKHQRFSDKALNLSNFCRELGLDTWIDREDIPQGNSLKRSVLEDKLRDAVTSSRLVVFFETYDELCMTSVSEPHDPFNWQIFEAQYAKEVLAIIPKDKYQYCIRSFCHEEMHFDNWPHLAYLIGVAVDAPKENL